MYAVRIDRLNPACMIFLVDQSGSMADPVGGSHNVAKCVAVADALNRVLHELVLRCVKDRGEGPRDYFQIAVLGYGGSGVRTALSPELGSEPLVWSSALGKNPLAVETRVVTSQGPNGPVTNEARMPVWFRPVADGGTPMAAAMNTAGSIARDWVDAHPNSFPPIVVNLTDGESTDGDPMQWAQRLQSLRTNDGSLLMFNLNISSTQAPPVQFPHSADYLSDPYSRQLFAMSSVLPPHMAGAARTKGFAVAEGARGFVFNAGLSDVAAFLNIGTKTDHLLR
jgi:hypothetical protein